MGYALPWVAALLLPRSAAARVEQAILLTTVPAFVLTFLLHLLGSTSSQTYGSQVEAVGQAGLGWADANLLRCFPALVVGSAARITHGSAAAGARQARLIRERRGKHPPPELFAKYAGPQSQVAKAVSDGWSANVG